METNEPDKPVSSAQKESKKIDIINLADSDEEISLKRKKFSSKCINYDCQNGSNLREATSFCFSFYHIKMKHYKKQEVCVECYDKALKHFQESCGNVVKGKYLIERECLLHDELVEIMDSDEESQKPVTKETVEYYSEENKQFIGANLIGVVNSSFVKFNIAKQVDYAKEYLNAKANKIHEQNIAVDKSLAEFQLCLDKIRQDIYSEFRMTTMELPSLGIVDVPPNMLVTNTLPDDSSSSPPKSTRVAERRSHRVVVKPVSYSELLDQLETVDGHETTGKSGENENDIQVISVDVANVPELPPKGKFVQAKPTVGDIIYAMKQSAFGAWGKARISEIFIKKENNLFINMYRVKFEGKKGNIYRVLSGKQIAYTNCSPVQLEIGMRVIAMFIDDSNLNVKNYFMGVVAEPLCLTNNFRYLIFFDDGYAQYVQHDKVLVIVECCKNVWEDIHPDSQLFIKKYLETYPERPMVKLHEGHVIKTEWNGKWWVARVLKVDGSLAQMYFDADARSEWIYRGSTRLGPLFLEMQAVTNRQEKGPHTTRMINAKKNVPYVEYTRDLDTEQTAPDQVQTLVRAPPRAVARKSTTSRPLQLPSGPSTIVPFLPTQQVQQPQSKVVYFTPKNVANPQPYVPHECSSKCKKFITMSICMLKGYNPLSKPLLCGWHRVICKYKGKKFVRYRAPCAKSLRNMNELHKYLLTTESDMQVDMFDFDSWVHCLAEFVLDKTFCSKRDISNGIENVPIPCVNYVNNSMTDFCNYSTKREPMEGVDLNLDTEFLCGCDCDDDCSDKTKCQCWQLTIREFRTINKKTPDEFIGYMHKRLPEFVTTGIYECNVRCKCRETCLNRVVQHPLQLKLQLFKTANRGWGIRCLNDIPQGTFICIYAGNLLTDNMANEGGINYGDEYLAELDYIEVVERQKDGYESDVDEPEFEEDGDPNDDEEFICSVSKVNIKSPMKTRLRKRNSDEEPKDDAAADDAKGDATQEKPEDTVTISDDEDTIREPSRFDPSSDTTMEEHVPKFKSVRKMFGENEVCYIMDAKNTGNIGRYLNHSCSPNVFVQNVFVDTHDLRFPWVAFFAMNYIRAGTELTWNYNYDVGSVPGKVIFCHCGSNECRGRLL